MAETFVSSRTDNNRAYSLEAFLVKVKDMVKEVILSVEGFDATFVVETPQAFVMDTMNSVWSTLCNFGHISRNLHSVM